MMTTTTWHEFLSAEGYQISDNSQASLSHSTYNPDQATLIPLVHYCAYTLDGPDGSKFLQGQTSCDLNQLSTEHSLLGTNCNPKGGVINFFRLMKLSDEQLLMRFACSIREKAVANFSKYIVFSKAELTPADELFQGLGLQGGNSAQLIQELTGQALAQAGDQISFQQCLIVRSGEQPRFECWGPTESIMALWQTLKAKVELGQTNDWLLADMDAGIALLDSSIQEEYIPQMLNLHAVDAVNFHKGCYTGQEIITRLQYRGKLNKCMYRAQVATDTAPSPGTNIYSSERDSAGQVTAAVPLNEQLFEIQMVLHIKAAEGELRLGDATGPVLELQPLPYDVLAIEV